ncbi:MAG: hypothetical protein WEB13_09735 [Dehalococcoidia bacterium]
MTWSTAPMGSGLARSDHINVLRSDEDECDVADILDLQYCSAFG